MFCRIFRFLSVIFLLSACAATQTSLPSSAEGQKEAVAPKIKKTLIESRIEARQLLGKHHFTDTNLCCRYISSYSYFGEAIVYERDGVYRIHGGLEGYYRIRLHDPFGGGYLKIDGAITEIRKNSFTFEGLIETAKLFKNDLHICPRTGIYTFSREKHAAYWRLQSFLVPDTCFHEFSNEANYIDIFFQQEPE
jgi:hypothetical protein